MLVGVFTLLAEGLELRLYEDVSFKTVYLPSLMLMSYVRLSTDS